MPGQPVNPYSQTAQNPAQAGYNPYQSPTAEYTPGAPDETLKYIVPIGASPLAIIAGYLGLFSFLCVPAPLAIIIGILALIDLRKHPEKRGHVRAWVGIVLGLLVVTILAGLMIIGAMAEPGKP